MSYTFPEPDEVALLILHKHAKVRVEDLAKEKHEKLLPDTTIILTLLISKYDLVWGEAEERGGGEREREGRTEGRGGGERERERGMNIHTPQYMHFTISEHMVKGHHNILLDTTKTPPMYAFACMLIFNIE